MASDSDPFSTRWVACLGTGDHLSGSNKPGSMLGAASFLDAFRVDTYNAPLFLKPPPRPLRLEA